MGAGGAVVQEGFLVEPQLESVAEFLRNQLDVLKVNLLGVLPLVLVFDFLIPVQQIVNPLLVNLNSLEVQLQVAGYLREDVGEGELEHALVLALDALVPQHGQCFP